jgi:hypothetical protein
MRDNEMVKKNFLATGVDRIVRGWLVSMDRQGTALPTGSVMVAVAPDIGMLKQLSAGSLTGQARALLHVIGNSYDEESKRASAGYRQDQDVFWCFIGHDANRLHEPWVKDIIVERIAAHDKVFIKAVMRRSAQCQPDVWANRRWVLARAGEFLYQGMSFYSIWELSKDEWKGPQGRGTRRREFRKAVQFYTLQVRSLASQYLRVNIAATGPSVGIRHTV